jgi:hypothetical protein
MAAEKTDNQDFFIGRGSELLNTPGVNQRELVELTDHMMAHVMRVSPAVGLSAIASVLINIIPIAAKTGREMVVLDKVIAGVRAGVLQVMVEKAGTQNAA